MTTDRGVDVVDVAVSTAGDADRAGTVPADGPAGTVRADGPAGRVRASGPAATARADGPAVRRVRAAFERIEAVDRPEVWITLVEPADVLAAAAEVDARVAAGEDLPLAGVVLAVKDNVDVAGLPTTAACPSYATSPAGRPGPPTVTAPAVQRLVDAGVVVLGKTNLDQFATGLVGTRSPFGAVRHATLPERVSGGSSSGSAVAVALGIADLAIGTDTAGSGRVPAAFHGIVGIKTTVGLVPTAGVVPACRTYDVVTTFSRDLALGALATRLMVGPDASDPSGRTWPADVRLALRATPVVAVPRPEDLAPLSPGWRAAFDEAVAAVAATGARVRTVDVSAMLDAATLLYDGAIVAERYEAVGAFLDTEPADADPTVAAIIRGGRDVPAHAYVADRARLDAARADALVALDGCDLLLLPTTTEHPTIAAVQADPVAINRRLGTYTNFVNLLDLAAVAVPAGEADGGPFGVTVLARAFDDQLALDLAARLLAAAPPAPPGVVTVDTSSSVSSTSVPPAAVPSAVVAPAVASPPGASPSVASPSAVSLSAPLPVVGAPLVVDAGVDVLVVGAHLRGQPLNGELEDLGARFVASVRTSDAYRLVALDTTPRKPGLVRLGPGHGAPIAGEVWRVAPGALGRLLAALPGPMNLGQVELEDGTWVVGFGCTAEAGLDGTDLTWAGGWVAALQAGA